jgi:HEAT repeat protein
MSEHDQWCQDLKNQDVNVRASAAEKLCTAGADAVDAAVELVKACGDAESVRTWAVAALEEIGPPPLASIGSLNELVSSTNSLIAYWAVTLIGRLGLEAAESHGVLVTALTESQDDAVRERAAWALGKVGTSSDSVLKALDKATLDKNVRLSRLAKESLELLRK